MKCPVEGPATQHGKTAKDADNMCNKDRMKRGKKAHLIPAIRTPHPQPPPPLPQGRAAVKRPILLNWLNDY